MVMWLGQSEENSNLVDRDWGQLLPAIYLDHKLVDTQLMGVLREQQNNNLTQFVWLLIQLHVYDTSFKGIDQ